MTVAVSAVRVVVVIGVAIYHLLYFSLARLISFRLFWMECVWVKEGVERGAVVPSF